MLKVKDTYKKIFIAIVTIMIIIGMIAPLALFADISGNNSEPPVSYSIDIQNPLKGDVKDVDSFLRLIINEIILPIGAVIAVIMIIYAGFLYVTAGGNESKIAKAHQALLYGVVGAAILLGAWVIANAIGGTVKQLGG